MTIKLLNIRVYGICYGFHDYDRSPLIPSLIATPYGLSLSYLSTSNKLEPG